MAESFFNLTLDTTSPQNFSFTINDGAAYTAQKEVSLAFTMDDGDTSGYQIKIWGINGTDGEDSAEWEMYTATKSVTLTDGDELKTIYAKVRDDVHNESDTANSAITLITSVPVVTISSGPDVARISKKDTKDTSAFSFVADSKFVEWKVMVVKDSSALENTETNAQIPNTNGSTNMTGTTATEASTAVQCSIKGADLEAASSGDGVKIVKVFVKNEAGTWSVA